MTGMIVTGHGSFATGIASGIRLLAGEPEQFVTVDFAPEDSIESLTAKLEQAVQQLAECSGILIYADLTGGSPFNVSIRMKMEYPGNMEVIGGANLPAVLDGYMRRTMTDELLPLAGETLEAGKQAMALFHVSAEDEEDYEE